MQKLLYGIIIVGLGLVSYISYKIWFAESKESVAATVVEVKGRSQNDGIFRINTKLPSDVMAKSGEFVIHADRVNKDPGIVALLDQHFNEKNFIWAMNQSQLFQRRLKLIKDYIINLSLTRAAMAEGVSTQKYIEDKVGSQDVDKKEQYVFENLLSLPIEINLERPNYTVEVKADWTPSFGEVSSSKKVIVFSDVKSETGRALIAHLPQLHKRFPEAYVAWRPLYPQQDEYQRMVVEMGFCVWVKKRDRIWKFLSRFDDFTQAGFEKRLYKIVAKLGDNMDVASYKSCLYERTHQEVVEYHFNYAKYLGISTGPIVFIDGEVLVGVSEPERLESVLAERFQF